MTDAERRRELVDGISLRDVVEMHSGIQIDVTRFLCPFHDDRVGSLELIDGERRFHCIVCEASGGVVDFLRLWYRVTPDEALNVASAYRARSLSSLRGEPTRSSDDS